MYPLRPGEQRLVTINLGNGRQQLAVIQDNTMNGGGPPSMYPSTYPRSDFLGETNVSPEEHYNAPTNKNSAARRKGLEIGFAFAKLCQPGRPEAVDSDSLMVMGKMFAGFNAYHQLNEGMDFLTGFMRGFQDGALEAQKLLSGGKVDVTAE